MLCRTLKKKWHTQWSTTQLPNTIALVLLDPSAYHLMLFIRIYTKPTEKDEFHPQLFSIVRPSTCHDVSLCRWYSREYFFSLWMMRNDEPLDIALRRTYMEPTTPIFCSTIIIIMSRVGMCKLTGFINTKRKKDISHNNNLHIKSHFILPAREHAALHTLCTKW